ncbi:MAG: stage II sporulation protein R [Firmicutes bacterium]|nr:stage II sporulation protein R [Bacillota bacterium]
MFRYRLLIVGIMAGFFLLIGSLGSGFARVVEPALESYNRNNLIRLHVVADSDLPEDQKLKLKVRDEILRITEPLLLKVEDPEEAREIIRTNLPLLEETARRVLRENKRHLSVKASLERFYFPEIAYVFGILPAGEYQGLKITLGSGQGRNWWCVLYPPLCLLDPDAPSVAAKSEEPLQVEYRLALLEELIKRKDLALNNFWKGWGRFFGLL